MIHIRKDFYNKWEVFPFLLEETLVSLSKNAPGKALKRIN
jgi:hypothetical protein